MSMSILSLSCKCLPTFGRYTRSRKHIFVIFKDPPHRLPRRDASSGQSPSAATKAGAAAEIVSSSSTVTDAGSGNSGDCSIRVASEPSSSVSIRVRGDRVNVSDGSKVLHHSESKHHSQRQVRLQIRWSSIDRRDSASHCCRSFRSTFVHLNGGVEDILIFPSSTLAPITN
ncbi:hypothetical protein Syun_030136 [Stephania yunnanensis]|uniref:Uncharacterized protein n=1 Tax=Stephania yunnanensis TaxID=152371 RepID=A0AAP0EAA4_9MAGN